MDGLGAGVINSRALEHDWEQWSSLQRVKQVERYCVATTKDTGIFYIWSVMGLYRFKDKFCMRDRRKFLRLPLRILGKTCLEYIQMEVYATFLHLHIINEMLGSEETILNTLCRPWQTLAIMSCLSIQVWWRCLVRMRLSSCQHIRISR